MYGERNVVIIVIVPTSGSKKKLVAPTSDPPFVATIANSTPEEDWPRPWCYK